jgi:predicted ATP-grasp superfamily ATP-dependent carboligase
MTNLNQQILFFGHDRGILEMYCSHYEDIIWILHKNSFIDKDLLISKTKVVIISDFDSQNCILYLNKLIDHKKVIRCVSYHEVYHDLANNIAEFYNASSNIEFSSANLLTKNKERAREISNSLSKYQVMFYIIRSSQELDDILTLNSHKKFILKPRLGTASEKVKLIDEKYYIENDYFNGQDFLLEEFIDGKEYSVDTVSHNGIHKVIAIGENNFFTKF